MDTEISSRFQVLRAKRRRGWTGSSHSARDPSDDRMRATRANGWIGILGWEGGREGGLSGGEFRYYRSFGKFAFDQKPKRDGPALPCGTWSPIPSSKMNPLECGFYGLIALGDADIGSNTFS